MTDRRRVLFACLMLAGCATGPDKTSNTGPSLTTIQAEVSIAALEFSLDSKYLVHLDTAGGVRFWDVFAAKTSRKWIDEDFRPLSIIAGRDDRFAVASGDVVRVRRLGTGLIAEFKSATTVAFLRFDQLSRTLAVADVVGTVDVYDIESKKKLRTFRPEPADATVTVVPGAAFGVMYLYAGGRIQVVSCGANGPGVSVSFARRPGSAVSIAADGRRMALFNPEGRLEVRSVPDGKIVGAELSVPWEVESMQLSPDGSVVAIANQNVGVWLWDTAKNQELDRFDSKVWTGKGIGFSHDGNFLAWVERDRKTVRFWAPARGVVQWIKGEPVLIDAAKPICSNLAETIRFRRATPPFGRGMKQLAARQIEDALASFARVAAIMPNYPGLNVAREEAAERKLASVVTGKLEVAEGKGDYHLALRLLDTFLRDNAKFEDYGFRERAKTLRAMIPHLDTANEHRKAGREVDAVLEFEAACKIVPLLMERDTGYVELRQQLLDSLKEDTKTAFAEKDYVRVIRLTKSLKRLRDLDGELLIRFGVSHELLGNSTQAEKVYTEVEPGTREYVAACRSIARIARVAGDYTKARRHLEAAKAEVVLEASLEAEYAQICQLCKDYDAAVAAWRSVGDLEKKNPEPFANIASIEEIREQWKLAAEALKIAIERSKSPRPKLQVRMAMVMRKAGSREPVVEIYRHILTMIKTDPELVAFLGSAPTTTVENWIRGLDYVYRRKEWIPRSQFLEEQGWENHDGRWLRPREARLREVAERYRKVKETELRAFSDARYESYAEEHSITKGMNRREVIKAWGFFAELTVFKTDKDKVVFEQLNFEHSRKVYLRNGLVCYWSE